MIVGSTLLKSEKIASEMTVKASCHNLQITEMTCSRTGVINNDVLEFSDPSWTGCDKLSTCTRSVYTGMKGGTGKNKLITNHVKDRSLQQSLDKLLTEHRGEQKLSLNSEDQTEFENVDKVIDKSKPIDAALMGTNPHQSHDPEGMQELLHNQEDSFQFSLEEEKKRKRRVKSDTESFSNLFFMTFWKLLPSLGMFLILLHLLPGASAIVYRKQMSERVITMASGRIRGVLVEFPNAHLRPVDAFFGLKYADLEKGNMRFMPPKHPKEHWANTRHAIALQPPCPQPVPRQMDGLGSTHQRLAVPDRAAQLRNITPFLTEQMEDCLTLNLYVPERQWNDTTQIPVMVFIHGESYDTGTGNAYDGSVLSSFGDVIVVTLNYRLGVLGFLTTLDKEALGNRGLFDIIQALIWLQENIVSFHGDPDSVTLFGHGHGASLVNLLLLSPLASKPRPLFQRAILQSGSALATWALSYDPIWCTEKLAYDVNCSSHIGHSNRLVNCLRQRTVTELLEGAPQAPKYYSCFAPSADNWTALPAQVEHLIKERKSSFSTVPLMLGITKNEAYSYLKQQEIHGGLSDLRKSQIIRTYVQNVYRYHRQKIYEILDHLYTDWTKVSNKMSNRDNVLELLSDGQYVAPLIRTANYHAETADTYLYAFSHSTQSESSTGQDSEDVQGIHGDELPYVFGSPLVGGVSPFPSSYTAVEKMMSEAVMTYWTNFARTGDPNRPRKQTSLNGGDANNRFNGLTWPKYDLSTQQYLQISRRPAVRHHYRSQKLALWLDLIPKMNVADGSDPGSHQLNHADNRSTFDDHHRLIHPFEKVFPSPPPMPPLAPTLTYPRDEASTPFFFRDPNGDDDEEEVEEPSRRRYRPVLSSGEGLTSRTEGGSVPPPKAVKTGEGEGGVKCEEGGGSSTSSLSITVAVGCTLFFLNLLILAAVYYQHMRIRKLRHANENSPRELLEYDLDEARLSRKLEKEANAVGGGGGGVGGGSVGGGRGCGDLAGHETDSLMSAATGGGGDGGGTIASVGSSGVGGGGFQDGGGESPSVSRAGRGVAGEERGRGGGGRVSECSTLERRSSSPPTSITTPTKTTTTTSSSSPSSPLRGIHPSGGGHAQHHPHPYPHPFHYPPETRSYAPVPTHTTSPLHHPYHASSPPSPPPLSNIGAPSTSSYAPPAGGALSRPYAMNPFSSNYMNNRGAKLGGSASSSPPRGGPRGPLAARSEAADTGLYKVINKTAPNPPPPAHPSVTHTQANSREPPPSLSSSSAGRGGGGRGGTSSSGSTTIV